MIRSILLRYRDLIADTIPQHEATIARHGSVWWGWWRKPHEPQRLHELEELRARAQQGPFAIALYDRSKGTFFIGEVEECVFDGSGATIESPAPDLTPEYYRKTALPAWFRLSSIRSITKNEFVGQFGVMPTDDFTFYPVTDGAPSRADAAHGPFAEFGLLRGDTILHITDVHFGADFGFPAQVAPSAIPLSTILIADVRRLGANIGLIVASGDLTSRGDATHLFNNAIPFLEDLRATFGLEREHVLIVPGNHDIPYSHFSLTYDHETAFNEFLRAYYGTVVPQQRLVRYRLPSGRPVEMLTMSSVKLRTQETANYGWVDWLSCQAILSQHTDSATNAVRIGVLHHHLVTSLREERLPDPKYPYGSVSVVLNAGTVIEGLQSNGFQLVLHGHQHTPSISRVSRGFLTPGALDLHGLNGGPFIVAGGSAGATPARIDGDVRDNTYGLITLSETGAQVAVRGFGPAGVVRDIFQASLAL